jgi:hypothetical protein
LRIFSSKIVVGVSEVLVLCPPRITTVLVALNKVLSFFLKKKRYILA